MNIVELLKIILLGIVEGITEWLPISSTGHMLLVDEFIKLNMSDSFKEMFFVVIQLGAILAVVILYFNKLNPFSSKKTKSEKKDTIDLWKKVIIGCIPAAILGFLLDDFLEEHFGGPISIAIMLIVYGVIFIIVENKNKRPNIKTLKELSYKTAFLIGLFQVLALIPGTSRSGATIIGAMLLGTSRVVAAEFTFFLAIPVMFGASFLKLIKFGLSFTGAEFITLIIGMLVALFVSIIAIKFLMNYIKKHDFKFFGYYRIILGIIVIIYFLFN
ncbi:MAG: undecaprenyl-diphosphate phosphatase [Bacilli bacterium]|nr:undecaprenyl-diphosphate phosphatase [Bacilli bacterium]